MWPFTPRKPRPATPGRPSRRPCRPRLEALEDRSLMSAGALDPTFGSGAGYVTTSLSGTNQDQGTAVLVQPSGNIVVAGTTVISVTTTTKKGTTTSTIGAFGVVTYNPDGSLDTAFGSGGIVRQTFAGPTGAQPETATLEPMGTTGDSKILLAGRDNAQYGMALMRLNANGTLDTTFGSNGQVVTPFQTSASNASGDIADAVAVTSSGQILVAGSDGQDTVLLARYNPNGSLDTTFGSGGKATTVLPTGLGLSLHMAVQSDGKFVIAGSDGTGTSGSQGIVLRYNANGSLDPTFGNGGIVSTWVPVGVSPSTNFWAVAVYPNAGTANDGKIIAVGYVSSTPGAPYNSIKYAAVRYNADGSLDSTFAGGAGYEVIPDPKFAYPMEHARAVAIESDGKLILAGDAHGPGNTPMYSQLLRLNVDGSPDATFGSGGFVDTAIGTGDSTGVPTSWFSAVAIQPDGKVVAAGKAQFGSPSEFTLARYLPSQPEVGTFTASPSPVTSGTATTLTASNITDGNAGAAVTQVAFYVQLNGTNTLLGYGTQSSPGVWTFSYTASLTPGSYTLLAQAEDSDGVFGDPFALTLTVQ